MPIVVQNHMVQWWCDIFLAFFMFLTTKFYRIIELLYILYCKKKKSLKTDFHSFWIWNCMPRCNFTNWFLPLCIWTILLTFVGMLCNREWIVILLNSCWVVSTFHLCIRTHTHTQYTQVFNEYWKIITFNNWFDNGEIVQQRNICRRK